MSEQLVVVDAETQAMPELVEQRIARLGDALLQRMTECAEHNPEHPTGADTCPECTVRRLALMQLRDELEHRAGDWVAVAWRR